jgi:DNA-binding NarL/FixJ family response regulator
MNRGADDYLVKPIERADLLGAIRTRLQRQAQIAPARHAPGEESPKLLEALGLTPHEAETLFWVARGKTNPELCVLLEVRLTTIKKRLKHVFLKLGVDNRTAAAARALKILNAL